MEILKQKQKNKTGTLKISIHSPPDRTQFHLMSFLRFNFKVACLKNYLLSSLFSFNFSALVDYLVVLHLHLYMRKCKLSLCVVRYR